MDTIHVLAQSQPKKTSQQGALVAGVDEAGRGPLVGSVVAAAVILDPLYPISGLADSKKLTANKRHQLFEQITNFAYAWAIAEATHQEVDQINILQASMLAMQRAINALPVVPEKVLVDGNRCPEINIRCQAIIGGDALEQSISAASILAKVTRDRQMLDLDLIHPAFGFAKHKGYPTKQHFAAIEQHGIISAHRRSYAPIARWIEKHRS